MQFQIQFLILMWIRVDSSVIFYAKGPFALGDNDVFFLSSCANSYIDDNVTHLWRHGYNVKICVIVTECEWALRF